MHDIAEFLGAHDPFSGLDEAALEALARRVEVEFFAAGDAVGEAGPGREGAVRVVRRGGVELIQDGRLLDLIGEGEMLGHPSMLAGLPAGFEARAHEDALCYAIPAEEVVPLLARASGLRYLAHETLRRAEEERTGVAAADVARRTARSLIRRPALTCGPDESVREVARRMREEGAGSMLVRAGERLGIVTDSDLRRVVAEGLATDAPAREVMTAPLVTVGEDASGAEVMLAMLDHDIRHLPVLSARGEPLGVIAGIDLVAAEASAPFALRRTIARAQDPNQLRDAARALHPTVIALHRSRVDPGQVSQVISVVADALTRRSIELAIADHGPPPAEFAWISLGSHGRREPMPSSDIDSGMAWRDGRAGAETAPSEGDGDEAARWMRVVAEQVGACMGEIGWRLDPHGVTAAGAFSASSIGEWRATVADWLSRPADDRVLIAISITLDGRVVHGPPELDPKGFLHQAKDRSRLLGLLLRSALASKPPTGFLHGIVVEHGGEHRGTFDIKRGGLIPVIDIARYAGLKAGASVTSTVERLRAAAEADAIEPAHALTLEQAYELFASLRLEHQVRQLEGGRRPDDHLDPDGLGSLTRRYLRDAFREVAAVQRALARGLERGRGRI